MSIVPYSAYFCLLSVDHYTLSKWQMWQCGNSLVQFGIFDHDPVERHVTLFISPDSYPGGHFWKMLSPTSYSVLPSVSMLSASSGGLQLIPFKIVHIHGISYSSVIAGPYSFCRDINILNLFIWFMILH